MTLYQFTFQHPTVVKCICEYEECTDDMEAAYRADARAKQINYKLKDVTVYQ